jgi:hypothetical protein
MRDGRQGLVISCCNLRVKAKSKAEREEKRTYVIDHFLFSSFAQLLPLHHSLQITNSCSQRAPRYQLLCHVLFITTKLSRE